MKLPGIGWMITNLAVTATITALSVALGLYISKSREIKKADEDLKKGINDLRDSMVKNNGVVSDSLVLTDNQIESKKKLEKYLGTEITNLNQLSKAQAQYNMHLEKQQLIEQANEQQRKVNKSSDLLNDIRDINAEKQKGVDRFALTAGSRILFLQKVYDVFASYGLDFNDYKKQIVKGNGEIDQYAVWKILKDRHYSAMAEVEKFQSKVNKLEKLSVEEYMGVETKDGKDGKEVMYNDFVIVGSKKDPAKVEGKTTQEAFFSKTDFIFSHELYKDFSDTKFSKFIPKSPKSFMIICITISFAKIATSIVTGKQIGRAHV